MSKTKKVRLPEQMSRCMQRCYQGELDERGLVPLATARKNVKKSLALMKKYPSDGAPDDLFSAAISLKNGAEFLKLGASLGRWVSFGTEIVERYGESIVPWLATFIGKDGKFPEYNAADLMLHEINTPRALEVLLRAKVASGEYGSIPKYIEEHGAKALRDLADLRGAGNEAAHAALKAFVARAPSSAKKELTKALGRKRAEELLAGGAPGALTEKAILTVLDDAAKNSEGQSLSWPSFKAGISNFTYHAMRVIAARAKEGDDWGVLFEVVQGDAVGRAVRWPAFVQRYVYGSRVSPGGHYLEDGRPLRAPTKVPTAAEAKRLDLRPGAHADEVPADWQLVMRIRAALAVDRGFFFEKAAKAIDHLDLGRGAVVLVDAESFFHVVGKQGGKPASQPSKSETYRSLARAIVMRDPKAFAPGKPNTDWRLHVTKLDKRAPAKA